MQNVRPKSFLSSDVFGKNCRELCLCLPLQFYKQFHDQIKRREFLSPCERMPHLFTQRRNVREIRLGSFVSQKTFILYYDVTM